MKLNCDLGEGLSEMDKQVMPYIDLASIACGGHTGDRQSMDATVALASKYHVAIGAHPSYPDRENFGRETLNIEPETLSSELHKQIDRLHQVCIQHKQKLSYIKPHGALYNDLNSNPILAKLLHDIATYWRVPLVAQALPNGGHSMSSFTTTKIWTEAFADRRYTDDGRLQPRSSPNAVIYSAEDVLSQVKEIVEEQRVESISGKWLTIHAETICVHSDTPIAAEAIKSIHQYLNR